MAGDAFESQMQEKQRELAAVARAIHTLLDLAENFGSESAGPRLLEHEAEKARLEAELNQPGFQRRAHQLTVAPNAVEALLAKMHATLTGDDVRAKRALLTKVLVEAQMGQTGGELTYTFPLAELTGICSVPPKESESLSPSLR